MVDEKRMYSLGWKTRLRRTMLMPVVAFWTKTSSEVGALRYCVG